MADRPDPTAAARADTRADAMRDRLLDASIVVFGRRGYEDARVEDICQAAGTARATFYRYFSGKDDVFDALLVQLLAELDVISAEVEAVTPDRAGFETLRDFVAHFLLVSERWSPVVEALSVPRRVPSEQRDKATASIVRISRRLGASIEAGATTAGDANNQAMAVVALVEGVGHQLRTWDIPFEREALLDAITTLALRMLHPGTLVVG